MAYQLQFGRVSFPIAHGISFQALHLPPMLGSHSSFLSQRSMLTLTGLTCTLCNSGRSSFDSLTEILDAITNRFSHATSRSIDCLSQSTAYSADNAADSIGKARSSVLGKISRRMATSRRQSLAGKWGRWYFLAGTRESCVFTGEGPADPKNQATDFERAEASREKDCEAYTDCRSDPLNTSGDTSLVVVHLV